MEEKKTQIPEEETALDNAELTEVAGGFPIVPTVPVSPIDEELRDDV